MDVRDPSSPGMVGQTGVLALRPEQVRLEAANAAHDLKNHFAGRICDNHALRQFANCHKTSPTSSPLKNLCLDLRLDTDVRTPCPRRQTGAPPERQRLTRIAGQSAIHPYRHDSPAALAPPTPIHPASDNPSAKTRDP